MGARERLAGKNSRFGVSDYDAYWDGRIDGRHYEMTDVHRKIVATARELLGSRPARVLDCGVGPGHVFRELARHYETYGLEISERAFSLYDFDASRVRLWDLNDGLPPDMGLFDLIIASRIVHHLAAPASFVRSVKAALRDEGLFLGVIPNICYYHHRLKFLCGRFPPVSSAHVNFQTGPDFAAMVCAEGFRLQVLTTPKKTVRAWLWPTVFSQDLLYVFRSA
jgi:SAM-dependent methyltransferase